MTWFVHPSDTSTGYRPEQFIKAVRAIPTADEDPARLEDMFWRLARDKSVDPAVRYYLLSRTSWGSLPSRIHRGGLCFSQPAGWKLTRGHRLWRAAGLLQGVTVTATDYLPVLQAPGEGVWIYCDPPSVVGAEGLYRHAFTAAQHFALAGHVRACHHNVLVSYDDTLFIREVYSGLTIYTEDMRYRLRTGHRVRARELLIANY